MSKHASIGRDVSKRLLCRCIYVIIIVQCLILTAIKGLKQWAPV